MSVEQKTTQPFQIRAAAPDDARQIRDVHINAVRTLAANDYTPAQIEAWVGDLAPDNYRYAMQELGEAMFVASQQDRIVGFASLLGKEVRAVYVHPDYARQGIGSALLNAVEHEARSRGMNTLQTAASLTAVPFYQVHRYQIITEFTLSLPNDIDLPCVNMEKWLFNDCKI